MPWSLSMPQEGLERGHAPLSREPLRPEGQHLAHSTSMQDSGLSPRTSQAGGPGAPRVTGGTLGMARVVSRRG